MHPELLLKNISRHIQLNEEEVTKFISMVSFLEIEKNTLLQEEGRSCKYLYFIHDGALRAWFTDKNGKESTIMFAIADWWVTDMFCFLNEKPAMMNIGALKNSAIVRLSKEHFDKLFIIIPKFERFFRILMQNAYTREQIRVIENLSLTAEARYDIFMRRYPQIVKQVTQKQIASYLGITPEFLSAIRKKKMRGSIS